MVVVGFQHEERPAPWDGPFRHGPVWQEYASPQRGQPGGDTRPGKWLTSSPATRYHT
jgi:hypothetical protein